MLDFQIYSGSCYPLQITSMKCRYTCILLKKIQRVIFFQSIATPTEHSHA